MLCVCEHKYAAFAGHIQTNLDPYWDQIICQTSQQSETELSHGCSIPTQNNNPLGPDRGKRTPSRKVCKGEIRSAKNCNTQHAQNRSGPLSANSSHQSVFCPHGVPRSSNWILLIHATFRESSSDVPWRQDEQTIDQAHFTIRG